MVYSGTEAAGQSEEALTYIAIDVETTGLNPERDRIVEVGAIRFDQHGNQIDTYISLVNPGCSIQPNVTAIHGIKDEDVAEARSFREIAHEFMSFICRPDKISTCNDSTNWNRHGPQLESIGIMTSLYDSQNRPALIAHNSKFDASFISCELKRNFHLHIPSYPIICTLSMAKRKFRFFRSRSLTSLACQLSLLKEGESITHRSYMDCILTSRLWRVMRGWEESCTFDKYYISSA
jgi:DNA polymerase III epsilon subunit-like protein